MAWRFMERITAHAKEWNIENQNKKEIWIRQTWRNWSFKIPTRLFNWSSWCIAQAENTVKGHNLRSNTRRLHRQVRYRSKWKILQASMATISQKWIRITKYGARRNSLQCQMLLGSDASDPLANASRGWYWNYWGTKITKLFDLVHKKVDSCTNKKCDTEKVFGYNETQRSFLIPSIQSNCSRRLRVS